MTKYHEVARWVVSLTFWLFVVLALVTLFCGCATVVTVGRAHFYHQPTQMNQCFDDLCVKAFSLVPETDKMETKSKFRENKVVVTYKGEKVVDVNWMGGMLTECRVGVDAAGVRSLYLREMFYDGESRWLTVWERPKYRLEA